MIDDILDENLEETSSEIKPNLLMSATFMAIFALGFLAKTLHLKNADVLVNIGAVTTLGYNIGYLFILRFKHLPTILYLSISGLLIYILSGKQYGYVEVLKEFWFVHVSGITLMILMVWWLNRKKLWLRKNQTSDE